MSNINDYLDWRSDLTFEQDPFNEVDNLILSELIYTRFDNYVPGIESDETVSIEEVCERFFADHSDKDIMSQGSSTKVAPYLMKKMINTNRFGNTRLGKYVSELDKETQSQFSAMVFYLNNGQKYVAYRGTDDTLVGWKEDFNMCFLYQTAGQLMATNYLNTILSTYDEKIMVGGHSKGGNFAVFASAFCDNSLKDRISIVYSNDGPGFLDRVVESMEYRSIVDRVHSTLPTASVVGMLLGSELNSQTIKASNVGIMQHNPMNWQVMGNKFVKTDGLKAGSIFVDEALKKWVEGVDNETRALFVDVLFEAMAASGADKLSEVNGIKTMAEMAKLVNQLPDDQKKTMMDVMAKFGKSNGEVMFEHASQMVSEKFSKTFNKELKTE